MAFAALCSVTAMRWSWVAATSARSRYFPEVVAAVCRHLPARCVIDGEILIPGAVGLDFDALLQRIHPADSRVQKLAAETPASFVAFDLLAVGDRDLTELPLSERRAMLESVATTRPPIFVTPISTDIATAEDWFSRFEGRVSMVWSRSAPTFRTDR